MFRETLFRQLTLQSSLRVAGCVFLSVVVLSFARNRQSIIAFPQPAFLHIRRRHVALWLVIPLEVVLINPVSDGLHQLGRLCRDGVQNDMIGRPDSHAPRHTPLSQRPG